MCSADAYECFIADKGYDSKALRELISNLNKTSIIPKCNYGKDLNLGSIDKHLYKIRHLVENASARIKHYRAIATRYDKLEIRFKSTITIAFIMMWLPMHVQKMLSKCQQPLIGWAGKYYHTNWPPCSIKNKADPF